MKFSNIKIIKWLIGLPMKTKIISAGVAGTIVVGSGVGIGIAVNNSKEPIKLVFSSRTTNLISDISNTSFSIEAEGSAIFEATANTTLTVERKEGNF